MWKVGFLLLYSFLFSPWSNDEANGQRRRFDTEEIESLIDEWNFANNTRSVQSFEKVYAERLLFNAQTLPRSKAIALKLQSFDRNPDFRQRIVTVIKYTPYSSGVIRCDFTKEVRENGTWKQTPSYLLVRNQNDLYSIVGEIDIAANRRLPPSPEPEALDTFERIAPPKPDSIREDSSPIVTTSARKPDVRDTVDTAIDFKILPAILAPILSKEMIAVPKGYVFILIGMLMVGGLMIFIADSIHRGRRRNGAMPGNRDIPAHAVQQSRPKSVFEGFVITLFDPLFFSHRKLKPDRISDGKVLGGERGPDFEFEFNHKGVHTEFGIKCLYYKYPDTREVQLFSPSQQQNIRHFEEEKGMDVYYVLGFGGKPDDPKELYLLPSNAMRREFVSKTALRHYSKSGMFFFNSATGRLQ